MIPLFEHFPALRKQLPYAQLADLPTPVERLSNLGGKIGVEQLWVKRDDIAGRVYGGNKIRKLELLLGDALSASNSQIGAEQGRRALKAQRRPVRASSSR